MFTQKTKKRTTFPSVQRRPGQSLREEWDRLVNDNLPFIVFTPLVLWFVWFTHWLPSHGHRVPVDFWLYLAIIMTGMCAIGYLRLIPRARRLVRGERGELRVAEVLDDLRRYEYRPFHDVVRDGFNVDHVVVGPGGVFAIETKFRSGQGVITFRNGEGLFVGGFPEEKDSLNQARGNAAEVNRLIKENCHIDVWVKPVVVFVGDWRVKNDWRNTDARVFTTDTLSRHILNQQPCLTRGEIELIASHLERSAKG
jgi:Nuclease-related domain